MCLIIVTERLTTEVSGDPDLLLFLPLLDQETQLSSIYFTHLLDFNRDHADNLVLLLLLRKDQTNKTVNCGIFPKLFNFKLYHMRF